MRYAWLGCLLLGSQLLAGTQDSEFNVNTRYTVETVVLSGDGWTSNLGADPHGGKISSILRRDILALIGNKLNPAALDQMANRLRREFHAHTVERHVLRGKAPESVQVVFKIELRPTRFDLSVPRFLYSSRQGWSGGVQGAATVALHNSFTVGIVSDSDQLAERYAGVVARYENTSLGADRARLAFQFESYHDEWSNNTLALQPAESSVGGLYRSRENFQPEATLVLAKPLSLTIGTSFERLQEESPDAPVQSANAVFSTLRYHETLEDSDNQQDLDADYSLRSANRALGSDFIYARHRWDFRYTLNHGKAVVIEDLSAGIITGRAPIYERFVLGNSSTLRGWNKYDLDPFGGNRMVHNSVDLRYGLLQIFYDSGAVWDRGDSATIRHSAGIGVRQGIFSLALAFPLRDGRIDPVLLLSMNY
ncbi:MAG TPA: BamA/TamA family outer membrane protein [Bryobacteraceae bacterium]|nr:BamA/TamA family outer membrane protein [Bryobacteraceae bacterium]